MSSTVTASARQYTAASSEFLSRGDASVVGLDFNGDVDMYTAGWYSVDTAAERTLLAKYNSNNNNRQYLLRYNPTGTTFNWIVSGDGSTSTSIASTTFGTPTTNTFHFVETYHDATGDLIGIAVNGGAWDTTAHSTGLFNGSETFALGRYRNSSGTYVYMQGAIGPTGVWSSIPDASKRASLYNAGAGKLFKDLTTADKVDMISYWDGAETSGIGIDAMLNNDLTDNNTVTSAAGKVTYTAEDASQFTAANSEFLSRADASLVGLDFNGNVDMYLAAWVYIDAVGADRPIIGKWSASTGNRQYLLSYFTGTTQFGFFVSNDGAATVTNYASTFGTVPTGTWLFVQAYHDATNDLIGISVNNGAYNTAAHSTGIFNSAASFDVGRYRNGSGTFLYMDGRLASCIATSGIPTADEQTALYQRGFGRDYSDLPALSVATYVSVWELTEASGTRVDSVTASANDLTDNNSVTGNPGVVYDAPAAPVGGAFLQSRPISLRIGLGL